MKKYFFTIIALLMLLGCSDGKNTQENLEPEIAVSKSDILSNKKENTPAVYDSNILEMEKVLVNGHKVLLPISEFNSKYKEIDSTKTELWECGNPFEWLDAEWMRETYGNENKERGTFGRFDGNITTLFAKHAEFNTNNHVVLFNTALAETNSLEIPSYNILLNKNTSLEDFKRMFPKSEMEKLENPNEVRFRFFVNKDADDAFLFYFENGKLSYFTLWWLLC